MGECCNRIKGGPPWERSPLIGVDDLSVDGVFEEAECNYAFENLGDGFK